MIKYLKRIENLLLVIPFLFLVITWLWFAGNTLDIHLHDTMFVISTADIFRGLFFLMIFYFMFHLAVRQQKWETDIFCRFHAMGTAVCILIIGIVIISQGSAPIDHEFSYADYRRYESSNKWVGYLVLITVAIFILLQVLFFLYFLVTIIKKISDWLKRK